MVRDSLCVNDMHILDSQGPRTHFAVRCASLCGRVMIKGYVVACVLYLGLLRTTWAFCGEVSVFVWRLMIEIAEAAAMGMRLSSKSPASVLCRTSHTYTPPRRVHIK